MHSGQITACLNCLYSIYGPPMEKNAAAQYLYEASKVERSVEALGQGFVKHAHQTSWDPWALAYNVASRLDGLEKIARHDPGEMGNLARFYVNWASGIEKRALIGQLMHYARGARAALPTAIGRAKTMATPSSRRMTQAIAGKAPVEAGEAGRAFQRGMERSRELTAMGGGSYRRGQKLLAEEAAERGAKAKVISGTSPVAFGAGATPARAAPAVAPAAAAGAVPAAPTKMDYLLGGGLLGGGLLGGTALGAGVFGGGEPQPVQ